jgi:hypothetical protein
LTDAEALVAFGHRLAFPDVTPDNYSGEWRVQTHLLDLDLYSLNLCLAALDQRLPPVQVILSAFGLKFGNFQIGLTRKPHFSQLLLATIGGVFGLEFRFLEFHVIPGDFQIIAGLDQFHLQAAIVKLPQSLTSLYVVAFLAGNLDDYAVSLAGDIYLMFDGKDTQDAGSSSNCG